MLVRLAPIATQNAQNSAWTAVVDSRFTPKLSTSTNARGANIAIYASPVGARTRRPDAVCISG